MAEDQKSATSKRVVTTYETKTYNTDSDLSGGLTAYRPGVAPRSVIIQRTSFGGLGAAAGGGAGNRGYSRERSITYGTNASMSSAAYAALASSGVGDVKSSREKEKKDMQDLNERFASYIEKVRFLEAQNRRLAEELEKLKAKWGKETTQIKAMYQAELDEARHLLDDAEKEKARLEIRVASMEEVIQELRQRLDDANHCVIENRELIDRQNQQLADYEGEVGLLRRRVEMLETDKEKDKKLIAQLQDALTRARADLDNETLLHIDAENRRQTLEEEIEFLKTIHDQEMKELSALAYRDTTAENRDFWKNEMGQALREIQQMYDDKLDVMKHELETSYNFKIQEFRTGATKQNLESVHTKEETKRFKTQITDLRDKLADLDARNQQLQRELDQMRRDKEDRERELEQENQDLKLEVTKLRAEMEAVLRELQEIVDAKLGLELEIAAYRKLLEGEENRVGLKQVVDMWSSSGGFSGAGSSGAGGAYGSGGGAGGAGGAGGSSFSYSSSSSSRSGGAGGGAIAGGSLRGEMSAKITYQRSAKGPLSIAECSQDGLQIVLENTGKKKKVPTATLR